jgi:uncharacterized protein (TIGR03435 family)
MEEPVGVLGTAHLWRSRIPAVSALAVLLLIALVFPLLIEKIHSRKLGTVAGIEGRITAPNMARLEQSEPIAQSSATVAPEVSSQNSVPADEKFEVVSVKQLAGAGGRGAPGSGATTGPCIGGGPQVHPGRFAVNGKSVYYLITAAYGMGPCLATSDRISGGPGWMKSDLWSIDTVIPEAAPVYTEQQFNNGNAPKLQAMLRNLLADRFKLRLHNETRDLPVYVLTVARNGPRLKPWTEEGARSIAPGAESGRSFMAAPGTIESARASMTDLARQLSMVAGRTVLDRTGLTGDYYYAFQFAPLNAGFLQAPANPDSSLRPSLFTVLEEQLGLKLESSRGPVEIIVIDNIEKPAPN